MPPALRLTFYRLMHRLPWPRSFTGRLLLVSFVGIHVPLLGLGIYLLVGHEQPAEMIPVAVVVLLATLAGTGLTWWAQYQLLKPVRLVTQALETFQVSHGLPQLPREYDDEVGRLMRSAQDCLESLHAMLTLRHDLAWALSHDLRSPVASMLALLDLIREDIAEGRPLEEIEPSIESAKRGLQKLLALVDGLLQDALRPDRGGMGLERETVVLQAVVVDILDEATNLARAKGVGLFGPDPGAYTEVPGDALKIRQILANLIYNAIKFTPPDGRVSIEIQDAGDMVEVSVVDTGIGMSPALRAELFRPFSPAQRRGTSGETGFGLGLWLARTYVRLHGGVLTCESEEGRGSRFRFTLAKKG